MMIRAAEPSDWPAIEPLFIRQHAEHGTAPLNIEKCKALTLQQIERGLVILAEQDGAVIGGMGLIEDAWAYSDERLLRDLFLYVAPEHRTTGVLQELLSTAEGIAEEFGMACYVMVVNDKRASKRVGILYGWTPKGYVLRVSRADKKREAA